MITVWYVIAIGIVPSNLYLFFPFLASYHYLSSTFLHPFFLPVPPFRLYMPPAPSLVSFDPAVPSKLSNPSSSYDSSPAGPYQ